MTNQQDLQELKVILTQPATMNMMKSPKLVYNKTDDQSLNNNHRVTSNETTTKNFKFVI